MQYFELPLPSIHCHKLWQQNSGITPEFDNITYIFKINIHFLHFTPTKRNYSDDIKEEETVQHLSYNKTN